MNIDTPLRELGPIDTTALREAILAQADFICASTTGGHMGSGMFGESFQFTWSSAN